MSNLKILHVYRTYLPDSQGGTEETIRQLCRGLRPFDIESRIFTPSHSPKPETIYVEGTKVIRVKLHFEIASCGFCLTSFATFKRQVAWADIVHYHFPWPFGDLLHLVTHVNKPTVVTYHADIVRQSGLMQIYLPLMNRFLKYADVLIATSPNYAASSNVLQQYAEKVSIVPIGIDRTSYPQVSAQALQKIRAQHGTDYFLFVGMLRYYKGLHHLISAALGAKFKVVIAGCGPLEHTLKSQVQSLRVTNVIFTGHVTDADKMALIASCRALVFPSHLRAEAFGVTLLEAAMLGKPLVSAEIGTGTSYINVHDNTGFVVAADNSQALREVLDKLHQEQAMAQQLGENAKLRYEALFTGVRMAESYREIYAKLLG